MEQHHRSMRLENEFVDYIERTALQQSEMPVTVYGDISEQSLKRLSLKRNVIDHSANLNKSYAIWYDSCDCKTIDDVKNDLSQIQMMLESGGRVYVTAKFKYADSYIGHAKYEAMFNQLGFILDYSRLVGTERETFLSFVLKRKKDLH